MSRVKAQTQSRRNTMNRKFFLMLMDGLKGCTRRFAIQQGEG
jgi:hypothetical protein